MTQSSFCFSVGIVTLHYKDSGFEIFWDVFSVLAPMQQFLHVVQIHTCSVN